MLSTANKWTHWQAEMHATLMFIVKNEQILLIRKKRGLGAGKINGPGGKIDAGETPLAAAIRETQEELCITPLDPKKIGELWFGMSDHPDILCHVFIANDFHGTPTETEEAIPLWFGIGSLPYQEMWADDPHWMPSLLKQQTFLGKFDFDGDHILDYEIQFDVVF